MMTLISAIFSMILATIAGLYAISAELMVMIDRSVFAATLLRSSFLDFLRWWIRVPGSSGLKEFLTFKGMCLSLTGSMVLGCRTLAPKYASSAASPKFISSIFTASGMILGSADIKPSTSVQISSMSASMALATTAAE